MDEVKKEIVYNLGLVYEQMGDAPKYIDAMKKIYEADYGYRDVAARVESSYDLDRRPIVRRLFSWASSRLTKTLAGLRRPNRLDTTKN